MKKPDYIKYGAYIGIVDKHGKEIHLGDTVKILIGKPNSGYKVIFEDGAFCFTGGQVGTCSFIKFRDELIEGRITGKPIHEPFQNFLEIVSRENLGTGSIFHPMATGGNTGGLN